MGDDDFGGKKRGWRKNFGEKISVQKKDGKK